ncbi:HAD family hydrolase [Mycobacteroides abscessus]|uniref:HAD family hydrolase n=1 Tax=Mycobacteroides abscessus TaxID=36809 RepID=UPI00078B5382|nr:HAD hydrolase-like protein [Mycobacteroides abscessus]AMU75943.1 phosphatase [Mycobacteroides abscessus]ANO24888.1 phosphatase [Mycobacteroides abscessus]
MSRDTAPRHIVWDWNGTLLDDNPAMLDSVNAVCEHFGRPAIDMLTWQMALCRPLWRCYGKILERDLRAPHDWAVVENIYHQAYRRNVATCQAAADAHDALSRAKSIGMTQSVLSMGLHDDVTGQVHHFGLHEYFDRIDGVKDAVAGGTKSSYLSTHLRDLDIDPEACVLIGDVVDDALAAQSVGAQCVLVTTGMTRRQELQDTGHPVADNLTDAIATLLGDDQRLTAPRPFEEPVPR